MIKIGQMRCWNHIDMESYNPNFKVEKYFVIIGIDDKNERIKVKYLVKGNTLSHSDHMIMLNSSIIGSIGID